MPRLKEDNKIRAIGFKTFNEDDGPPQATCQETLCRQQTDKTDIGGLIGKTSLTRVSNNELAYSSSYSAVIFDRVCFEVDKKQQSRGNLPFQIVQNPFNTCCSVAGSSGQRVQILKSISLDVPMGCIFGLLGPSSCGKTTLLRCLVGLLKPTSGSISILGEFPEGSGRRSRASRCQVPGPNVGYMPQDLALYEDFTIRQILLMFGLYMGMARDLIQSRIEFLTTFLDLPEIDRQIQTLSGGQKRRVSFAIACIHRPPLLIMDEPTVGVDPLLRKSIWTYLRRLAKEEQTAIIITTHYIEEAAQADRVALMRAGEILIQDTPANILSSNGCLTLEEAFLKICNNVHSSRDIAKDNEQKRHELHPQVAFDWTKSTDKSRPSTAAAIELAGDNGFVVADPSDAANGDEENPTIRRLRLMAQNKVRMLDTIEKSRGDGSSSQSPGGNLSMDPGSVLANEPDKNQHTKSCKLKSGFHGAKLTINQQHLDTKRSAGLKRSRPSALAKTWSTLWALVYKNYKRNLNSLPLIAFQFMLPIIQMISFSLCVGGKPADIGLGLVNRDSLAQFVTLNNSTGKPLGFSSDDASRVYYTSDEFNSSDQLLSHKYVAFIDTTILSIKNYDSIDEAKADVKRAKLWAAMEIGENFTTSILNRFDLDQFYQQDLQTIHNSVVRLYPDRSNKILDSICIRSLVQSYRDFLAQNFVQFEKLPVEVKTPIFDIKPNLISNSIDGYTESIAAGLLASLTYIMAAGLTTFIMVVERSTGILERTYTTGINRVLYLTAHALFRSMVMSVQVALVLFLTFYILRQPLVGSLWLAYAMLMTLNITGISYGLLVSSLVTDQNGAALTIVSSLVVKITLSGILWPLEAVPSWLRAVCYIQPLTMPVQALKRITLKGSGIDDTTVLLGFLVSISWLLVFLTISARRFKFYQNS